MSEESCPNPKRACLNLPRRMGRLKKGEFYKRMPRKPKVLKSDIRLSFASAFVNTYNSGNFDTIWSFMENYFQPSFTFEQSWGTSELVTKRFPPTRRVEGLEKGIIHWYTRCLMMPDLVVTAQETTVSVRSDGLTLIEMRYNMKATLISTIDGYEVIFSNNAHSAATMRSNEELYQLSKDRIQSFETYNQGSHLVLSPVFYNGTMKMHINSDNRIYRFEVIMDPQ
jgi:hypothetical protein